MFFIKYLILYSINSDLLLIIHKILITMFLSNFDIYYSIYLSSLDKQLHSKFKIILQFLFIYFN